MSASSSVSSVTSYFLDDVIADWPRYGGPLPAGLEAELRAAWSRPRSWSVDTSLKAVRVRDCEGGLIAKLPVTRPDISLARRIAAVPLYEGFVRSRAQAGDLAAASLLGSVGLLSASS